MIRQVEAMPDSFGSKKDSIVKLLVASRIGLTTVKISFEIPSFSLGFCLGFIDLRQEEIDFRGEIFFIDHIETSYHRGS